MQTLDSSLPLTLEQLMKATNCSVINGAKYLQFLKGACKAYDITTEKRLAAFFAQIGHESNNLASITENLNYSTAGLIKTWPSRFNETNAAAYAYKPEKIANKVYASRMGNGDESSGDGWRNRGRGFIQLTGAENYKLFSASTGEDFVSNPDKLLEPVWCALAAAWFWDQKKLNLWADKEDDETMTRKINGGVHGLADRVARRKKALVALKGFDATLLSMDSI